MENPLISACVISYNHAGFIRQALESVAMQKIKFAMELIIADDCSTDGTVDIIEDFIKNYAGKVIFLKREKNIGAANNFIEMIGTARGKYIAYLEGDDYWASPDKLQIQVDYLEANESVAISSHNSTILLNTGETYSFNRRDKTFAAAPHQGIYSIEDYIIKDFFHSSAIVYRRTALKDFPEWYKSAFGGDYFLVLLLAMNGSIHYINETHSVYRINTNSISHYSSRYDIYKNFALYLNKFNQYSDYRYDKVMRAKIFSFKYSFHYYHPNYLKKLWFVISHFGNILHIDLRVISRWGRFKILVPTAFLGSKVNLFRKNSR
jgi:glycosyltransferase involved in cell wall biosynthesis